MSIDNQAIVILIAMPFVAIPIQAFVCWLVTEVLAS